MAFATIHLLQVLIAQVVLIIPFAILFRALIAWTYNRTGFSILLAAVVHASFNTAAEIVSPVVAETSVAQILGVGVTALLAVIAVVWSKGTLGTGEGTRQRRCQHLPGNPRSQTFKIKK